MNTFDAIRQRRSIKHFDPEHKMTLAEEQQLLELALLSPTSFNIQNWRLLAVRDPQLRLQLREAAWDQAQVSEASLLLIVCANLNAWDINTERYWQNVDADVRDFMVPATREFYRDHSQLQRDEAMRSSGIIAQTIMLAAKAMDYDSCPMVGFDPDKTARLIKLPDDHVISMFITIGKRIKDAWPRPGQLQLNEILVEDSFED